MNPWRVFRMTMVAAPLLLVGYVSGTPEDEVREQIERWQRRLTLTMAYTIVAYLFFMACALPYILWGCWLELDDDEIDRQVGWSEDDLKHRAHHEHTPGKRPSGPSAPRSLSRHARACATSFRRTSPSTPMAWHR